MINRIFDNSYVLSCDICGKEKGGFDSFREAVDWKVNKAHGWRAFKRGGEWNDFCPSCLASQNEDYVKSKTETKQEAKDNMEFREKLNDILRRLQGESRRLISGNGNIKDMQLLAETLIAILQEEKEKSH
jgi:hypothetical protein